MLAEWYCLGISSMRKHSSALISSRLNPGSGFEKLTNRSTGAKLQQNDLAFHYPLARHGPNIAPAAKRRALQNSRRKITAAVYLNASWGFRLRGTAIAGWVEPTHVGRVRRGLLKLTSVFSGRPRSGVLECLLL